MGPSQRRTPFDLFFSLPLYSHHLNLGRDRHKGGNTDGIRDIDGIGSTDFIIFQYGITQGLIPQIFKGTQAKGSTIGKCPTRTVVRQIWLKICSKLGHLS